MRRLSTVRFAESIVPKYSARRLPAGKNRLRFRPCAVLSALRIIETRAPHRPRPRAHASRDSLARRTVAERDAVTRPSGASRVTPPRAFAPRAPATFSSRIPGAAAVGARVSARPRGRPRRRGSPPARAGPARDDYAAWKAAKDDETESFKRAAAAGGRADDFVVGAKPLDEHMLSRLMLQLLQNHSRGVPAAALLEQVKGDMCLDGYKSVLVGVGRTRQWALAREIVEWVRAQGVERPTNRRF